MPTCNPACNSPKELDVWYSFWGVCLFWGLPLSHPSQMPGSQEVKQLWPSLPSLVYSAPQALSLRTFCSPSNPLCYFAPPHHLYPPHWRTMQSASPGACYSRQCVPGRQRLTVVSSKGMGDDTATTAPLPLVNPIVIPPPARGSQYGVGSSGSSSSWGRPAEGGGGGRWWSSGGGRGSGSGGGRMIAKP